MSWRSTPLPKDWPVRRLRVLVRDGWRCRRCGLFGNQVDHVVPAIEGGTDHEGNLVTLCTRCHRSKTGREAQARQRRRREPERHPGFTE